MGAGLADVLQRNRAWHLLRAAEGRKLWEELLEPVTSILAVIFLALQGRNMLAEMQLYMEEGGGGYFGGGGVSLFINLSRFSDDKFQDFLFAFYNRVGLRVVRLRLWVVAVVAQASSVVVCVAAIPNLATVEAQ